MAKNDALKQQQRREMMLHQPVQTTILKMAVPTIIAFIINSIYSLADTYFVSSLGTNATAAVNVNASLDQMILMCGSMLAVGANSYIARLLGGGDEKKASRVLSTAFFLAAGMGRPERKETDKKCISWRMKDEEDYIHHNRGWTMHGDAFVRKRP